MRIRIASSMAMTSILCVVVWSVPFHAGAHCDTLDGPVIISAKAALENDDVTPVLKWVRKGDEGEIRELLKDGGSKS